MADYLPNNGFNSSATYSETTRYGQNTSCSVLLSVNFLAFNDFEQINNGIALVQPDNTAVWFSDLYYDMRDEGQSISLGHTDYQQHLIQPWRHDKSIADILRLAQSKYGVDDRTELHVHYGQPKNEDESIERSATGHNK